MPKINIPEIFNKDFSTPIIQGRILAKKDPIALGTVNGNVLLSRFLFRDLEKRFGSVKALNITSDSEYSDKVFDEFNTVEILNNDHDRKREDVVDTLTCLSRSEYEILISKFVKLQYLLQKEPNLLRYAKNSEFNNNGRMDGSESKNTLEQSHSNVQHDQVNGDTRQSSIETKHDISKRIIEFIDQKIEEAFIDSMGEYYLLDDHQIDRLWRFPLLELLLVGSFSNFKVAGNAFSMIDELVPSLPFELNFDKDDDETDPKLISSAIISTAKKMSREPIYVTPPFERENWGWQIEDEQANKSKKD
ncbi:hypothetical protein FDP41_010746 [Naegleria fowleri]|uniref:Uncharacterized protein n=1 Tax=Naegleria fowleri TaxID=5763 RepID=A0A6A5BZV7_NAEFO|nr:uncharacterized protein FDP41_010746 [Naegleria fowleri]KAF0982767.1 hypothetical protein FDP41_010746 [Naegleria fowleri]CAG4716709.1 unnamed protein product [Naegleria fowleri]